MTEKTVSQLDAQGYFIGPTAADEDPLQPGVWLFPAGAVDLSPPAVPRGKRARHQDGAFVMEDFPQAAPTPAAPPAAAPTAPPTPDEQVVAITQALQAELDMQARVRGYDSILSACSYAAQPAGAPFQAEGVAFLTWRSAVWQTAYAKLAEVKAGAAPMPTPAEAVAAMPALELVA